ncbi:hypothetical protein EVAR_69594_1, partial [Eumeta japonica]
MLPKLTKRFSHNVALSGSLLSCDIELTYCVSGDGPGARQLTAPQQAERRRHGSERLHNEVFLTIADRRQATVRQSAEPAGGIFYYSHMQV